MTNTNTNTKLSETWQSEQHNRILWHEPTAFAELCEVALPHLVAFLQQKFPQANSHLHENIAVDCLMAYHKRPEQYNPERLPLLAYLRMAVRYDMLTALKKTQNRQGGLVSLEAFPIESELLKSPELNEDQFLDEWLTQYTSESITDILSALDDLLDEQEIQILFLMLDGTRETESFAALMGLVDADLTTQRHEVKKAKDRVNKKLRRFGDQLRQTTRL